MNSMQQKKYCNDIHLLYFSCYWFNILSHMDLVYYWMAISIWPCLESLSGGWEFCIEFWGELGGKFRKRRFLGDWLVGPFSPHNTAIKGKWSFNGFYGYYGYHRMMNNWIRNPILIPLKVLKIEQLNWYLKSRVFWILFQSTHKKLIKQGFKLITTSRWPSNHNLNTPSQPVK